ncbi:unnamed protein product [Bemisia tabaci]|uniref:U-box domain-containing protein n=1 Tax=Bemisia tabaci TaxID=7038 RepID=A0A9P0AEE2_BEMTA|nr:unnamed protein product [Bemisia tabaci]
MTINFCHPCLNPEISCDTVCCDGYEVKNLIAVDPLQQKGLLADYFIKPPMTVTVKLICDVNLSHIIIYPRVGIQKSIGFEIYASQKSTTAISEHQFIGLGYIRNSEDCIVFSKKKKTGGVLSAINIPFSKHFLFSRVQNLITSVRTLSIKVTKTQNSSVPSLKRIEIWGHPSPNCDLECKKKVEALWKDNLSITKTQQSDVSSQSSLQTKQEHHESELVIPEEFMDVITFSIMTMPMLLPSGKIIDLSTLEKCAKVDAQSGRVPSDPFTGEIFTEERKPIFFSKLKVRIDKFLNDNSHHETLRFTSRTVGKRKLSNDSDSSSVKKIYRQLEQKNNISPNLFNHQSTSSAQDSDSYHNAGLLQKNVKQPFPASDPAPEKINLKGITSTCQKEKTAHCSKASSNEEIICIDDADGDEVIVLSDDSDSSCQSLSKSVFTSTSHNVDDILRKTLAGLPSFRHPTSGSVSQKKQCQSCVIFDTLYRLPCGHFFCRNCLLSNTKDSQVLCQNCGQEFSSSEPVRFHE